MLLDDEGCDASRVWQPTSMDDFPAQNRGEKLRF